MVLLTPAIEAKPTIIGFNEKIDQNVLKEHGIANINGGTVCERGCCIGQEQEFIHDSTGNP